MGYRHQFWVVARINQRYRTLAVCSSKNCGDTDAIHACWRLLTIFSSDRNRTLLRHDLDHAATREPSWWGSADNDDDKLSPFPFVQTCLVLGAAFDPRLEPYPYVYPVTRYHHSETPMNFLMHNQTGCTVVDITDLQQPQYCFMFYPSRRYDPIMMKIQAEKEQEGYDRYSWATEEQKERFAEEENEEEEEERKRAPFRCRPFPAETYLTWPGLEKKKFEPYEDLGHWSLIPPGNLRDLWPQIPWSEPANLPQGTEVKGRAQDTTHPQGPATLIKNTKWSNSISIADLLQKTRRDRETLDLSLFPQLPEATVILLLNTLADDDASRRDITHVDVSGNLNIGLGLVSSLLELLPKITMLSLFHTSPEKLPLASLHRLLADKDAHSVELHHFELYSAVFTAGNGLSASGDGDDSRVSHQGLRSLPNYHAPNGTVDRVVFLSAIMQDDSPGQNPQAARLPGGGLAWNQLLLKEDLLFPHDSEFFHADIPLHDAFLDPHRLSDWLPRLLWYFATNGATNDRRSCREGHAALGCACALALDTENGWRVTPIPAAAGESNGFYRNRRDIEAPMPPLGENGNNWTLLIVVEDGQGSQWFTRQCTALRYAFVGRDEGSHGGLVACGPGEFSTRTTGRSLAAAERDSCIPGGIRQLVRECERDEVEEVAGPFREKRERFLREEKERRDAIRKKKQDAILAAREAAENN
ncbi:hypothetical protein QBC47DRAFT_462418 [Echria macrotheca]|uniref:Uncharacterized protein n=1 Tax=Echria macrotheca TaxID=438768 RepID=A0AAJ0B8H3_9PEZI|nr:hypothetical protein QBC47DRAFT_462418 [Echria macrotheca]